MLFRSGKNLFGGDAFADFLVENAEATKDTEAGTVTYKSSAVSADILFSNFKENTQYTLIFTCTNTGNSINFNINYTDGSFDRLSLGGTYDIPTQHIIVSDKNKTIRYIRGSNNSGTTVMYYDQFGIFEGVLTADEFVPYIGQTLTAQKPADVPVLLPGIPVESGGNYTDKNGQHWVCDEVDFTRGKYTQRIGKIDSYSGEIVPGAYMSTTGNLFEGATVLHELAEHIEHDLTAEELAQYAALHTNYPNTTIYNDGGAGMEVKYVADTKLYIDKKFAELAEAILNN